MARPRKKDEDHRRQFLRVRVTSGELATIDERARLAGMSRSDYLRHTALAGRLRIARQAIADPAVIAALHRIGVNLNQITKTANILGKAPPALDQLCRKIEAIVMKAIGQEAEA